jgi:squalene-associated FAD-dependent desaturase
MSSGNVIVIGGGLAGITAALDCAHAGADVTLLEARGRLGGAAYSFQRDGLSVDNGQHVFLRCCTDYQELLARIGASELVNMQRRLDVAVLAPDGRKGRLKRSGLPAPLHLALSLLRYPFLRLGECLSLAWAMQRLRAIDLDDPRNDARSFGDWLAEHRQGAAAQAAVWDLITRPTVNLTAAQASLAQVAQVFQLGLLDGADSGDIGWALAPLSELHDRAAGRALQRAGVHVRLRSGVRALHSDEGAAGGFDVEASDGYSAHADAVVLAVPPGRAAKLLPAQAGVEPDFAQRLGRSAIVNLHIIYDRRVLDEPFIAGVGTPVQWVFDRTDSSGLQEGQYLAISLSAADDELDDTAQELRERYLPALAELLPAAREAEVKRFFVTREHSATFRAAPGARAARPGARTQLAGLALAGAYTDTGWPATMESAVRSGHAAARVVLDGLADVTDAQTPIHTAASA